MAFQFRGQTWCSRCGLEKDRLITVTFEREDGYQSTMRVCESCDKALREEMARR